MKEEFRGIERRLDRLFECLAKLEPLQSKNLADFEGDPYLRDIVERNIEVAAQACIDIANRIISLDDLAKPQDYYGTIIGLGEAGVLPIDFAQRFASVAGLRNVLVHEYADIDWKQLHRHLQKLDDFREFARHIQRWLKGTESE